MPIPKMGTRQSVENVQGDDGEVTPVQRARVHNKSVISYEPLTLDESYYAVTILQGLDQSGKTHFAFSAAAPILVLTFDPGNIRRGVARKYAGQKDIQLATFEVPKGLVATATLAKEAAIVADRYRDTFTEAATGTHFKTIIMDREDEAWELFRFDEFDGSASKKAHHYTPLNAAYKAMLKQAEKHKKNLIMIDACKDEWKNEKPTGNKVREGFKNLGMLSQVTLENQVDAYDNFQIQVIRCRDDATKNGQVITKEAISAHMSNEAGLARDWPTDDAGEPTWFDLSFDNVMSYLIGGTPEDWQ